MKMLPDSTRADSRALKKMIKLANRQVNLSIRRIHRSFKAKQRNNFIAIYKSLLTTYNFIFDTHFFKFLTNKKDIKNLVNVWEIPMTWFLFQLTLHCLRMCDRIFLASINGQTQFRILVTVTSTGLLIKTIHFPGNNKINCILAN